MTKLYRKIKELEREKSHEAFDQLRDTSFQHVVFSRCEPREIAEYVHIIGEDDNLIVDNFGEGTPEHFAYMDMFKWHSQEQIEEQYNIPGRGEDPTVTYGMLKQWIVDFHDYNQMDLPKGFHDRNKIQLLGMYHGMQETYNFYLEDILQD